MKDIDVISTGYRSVVCCVALLVFAGCTATGPIGPRVAVMPAPGKPFEVFAAEDRMCRQYAEQSLGLTPEEAASRSFAGSAAAGTAIGAVGGELIGGNRQGASVGAGMGLLAGSAAGSNQAAYASRDAQQRYDIAYEQCMYAKGNQIPSSAPYQPRVIYYPPPPPAPAPAYNPPPPPPPSGQ